MLKLIFRVPLTPTAAACILIFAGSVLTVGGTTNLSVWAYPGATGRMIRQPDSLGNRVMDYTSVGYKGGTVPIPTVSVKTNISPVAGDNRANIQAAINYVAGLPLDTNGFRGAVLLSAGQYPVSNTIVISSSGIVLRGVGGGSDTNSNTVLFGTYIGTNQPSLLMVSNSSTPSTGTTHNITNVYVPVGARSFGVDSTSGFSAGATVFVYRPSTALWITNLGMNQVSPAWTPGNFDLRFDRTITRVEGNTITLDEPIPTAIDQQYGGGTVYTYSWPGRITNIGIENLRGVSYFDPSVVTNTGSPTNYYSDEGHCWEFIQIYGSVQNAWVRNVTNQYFSYSCVHLAGISANIPSVRNVTVQNCGSLDPVSIITGERRYAFDLDYSKDVLVQNSYTRNDRHQFVTHALTSGPNVFVDDLSDNAWNDCGPHFRWGNGAIWDCASTSDTLEANNYGNEGTSHGWSGANEVDWNCAASGGFVVRNPPGARNWLIGGIGTIHDDTAAIPYPAPAGTYDSVGSNVFPNSLYYAQLQDLLAFPGLQTREYWLGQINQFGNANSGGDVVPVNSAWRAAVQTAAVSGSLTNFDIVASNQWIPFTFNYSLSTTDIIVGANLSIAMRSYSGTATNESLYLGSLGNSNSFSGIGWLPVGSGTNTTVRVLDLGSQINLLTNGSLNVAVAGDIGIDWAQLELQVVPDRTLFTNSVPPMADAYVWVGTNSGSNFGTNGTIDVEKDTSTNNQRQAYLRWNLSGYSSALVQARVRLTPVSLGYNGLEQGIAVVTNNAWSESTITWNNQPGGGTRFATRIPSTNGTVDFIVTPQVQAALATDGQFSVELFSLTSIGGAGLVSYASRENSNPASRPQLLLVYSNVVPFFSALTNPTISNGTPAIALTGVLSGTNGITPVYPNIGESVSATINSHTVGGAVTNSTGGFLINYNDASLAADSSAGSPYTITYSYAGNNSGLASAGNDTSTTMTVTGSVVTYPATVVWSGASAPNLNWSTAGDWTPLGPPGYTTDVKFYDTGSSSNPVTSNNIVSAGITLQSLTYGQTNGYHNTLINQGVTLTVSNNLPTNVFLVGTENSVSATQQETNTISGAGGSLIVTGTSSGSAFVIREGCTTAGTHRATLDMSGLDNCNISVGNVFIAVQGQIVRPAGTLTLAKTNIISASGSAPALDIGDGSSNGGNGIMQLGQSNALFMDSLQVGGQKSTATLQFNPAFTNANPFLYLRGYTDSRVTTVGIGDDSGTATSSIAWAGTANFGGGSVDAMVDVLYVGRGQNGSGTGAGTGTLNLSGGTFDVNTLEAGYQCTNTAAAVATGIVNVNGSAVLNVNTSLRLARYNGAGTASAGNLNIYGGTVKAANILIGNSSTSSVTVTNGTLSVTNSAGTAAAPIGTLKLSNARLVLPITGGFTNIFATTLNTDAATSNFINITSLPLISSFPAQFPLMKYSTLNSFNFVIGSMPSGAVLGAVSNNAVSGTVYLVVTQASAPRFAQFGLGTNGAFSVSGSGPTNQPYRIFATTNAGQAFTNWQQIGNGIFSNGSFSFSDPVLTNLNQRFYRVVTP